MTDQNDGAAQAAPSEEESLWNAALAERGGKQETPTDDPEPAPTAGPEPETDKAEAPEETPAPTAEDIWANATEAQREAFRALEHKWSSDKNRVSALNRKVTSLNREIGKLRTSAPSAPAEAAKPVDREKIKATREDYPDLAPAIDAIESLESRLAAYEAAERAASETAATAEADVLEETHPGWLQLLQQHSEAFQSFINSPDIPARHYRAWLENEASITDAAATGALIDAFKASLAPRPNTPSGTPDNAQSDRRQRQLAGSTSPATRGTAPVTSGVQKDGDPEEIWKQALRLRGAKA